MKKGFAAKMRDVCSQLRLAADVISADQSDGKSVLNGFYDAWYEKGYNKGVDRAEFLSWFDYEVIYVVLCATPTNFEPDDFEAGRLQSHIARREILALKHDMKTKNREPHRCRRVHQQRDQDRDGDRLLRITTTPCGGLFIGLGG